MALPYPFSTIPREELTFPYPTPIQKLDRISKGLSPKPSTSILPDVNAIINKVNIYVKREDVNSPLAFGGNKMRKLEYVVPDILSEKADVLVAVGGPQSNFMRQVAAVAAKLGIKAVLCKSSPFSATDLPPATASSGDSATVAVSASGGVSAKDAGSVKKSYSYNTLGNIQLSSLMDAVYTTNSAEDVMEEMKRENRKPYYLPSGASTHPLGGLGYARFAFELIAQEKDMGITFNTIIVSCSSGSTLGGMVAGFKLAAKNEPSLAQDRRLIGVDSSAKPMSLRATVLNIAKQTGGKIGLMDEDITEQDFILDERFNAGEYGKVDEATLTAVKYAASQEGMILDPVYTGKAFAGLMEMARKGEISGNVLFVHTGGAMVLSGYGDVV